MGRQQTLLRAALAVFTTLTLSMILLPLGDSEALASYVDPQTVSGNPTCRDFTGGGTQFKIEDPSDLTGKDSGTYTDGVLVVDLDIYTTGMGLEFDWSSNLGVDVVVVKGGPKANVYRYDPAATADTGLHSPFNPNSGKWYGLSHISFCYFPNETTSTEAVNTTTTPTIATTAIRPGTSSSEAPATSVATTTTIAAEVLPTHLTTSTTVAEVSPAKELPFTGVPAARLWILGVSLLGSGLAALGLARGARSDEE